MTKRIVKLIATFDASDMPDLGPLVPYALTMKQEIEVKGDEDEAEPGRTVARFPNGTNMAMAVMSHYTPEGGFLKSQALVWAQKVQPKMASQSITPCLSALCKDAYIVSCGNESYRFKRPMPGAVEKIAAVLTAQRNG